MLRAKRLLTLLLGDNRINGFSCRIADSGRYGNDQPVQKRATVLTSENVLSNLSVYAEAAGMSAGSYGYFIDAEAGVRWIPVKYVSVSGGYRSVSLKAQDKPDYAKVELKGPFAAASIRF